jgi:hypothetical protein
VIDTTGAVHRAGFIDWRFVQSRGQQRGQLRPTASSELVGASCWIPDHALDETASRRRLMCLR